MSENLYAELALPLPLYSTYSYLIPDELQSSCKTGCRVEVSFGNRWLVGVVFAISSTQPKGDGDIKTISAVLDDSPVIPATLLDLLKWVSDYYLAPIGEVLRLALVPGLLSAERLTIALASMGRSILSGLPSEILSTLPKKEQKQLLEKLSLLPQTGQLTLSSFCKINGKINRNLLRKWETLGFIKLSAGRPGQGVKHKSVAFISTTCSQDKALPFLKRSKKQSRVFLDLEECGEISRRDFCKNDSSRANAVRELIKKGLVNSTSKAVLRNPLANQLLPDHMSSGKPATLWPDQQKAIDKLNHSIANNLSDIFLLLGTTGSGKTEVYLQAAEPVINQGKTVLMLVPEISLTPQLVSRVQERFGDAVALLHSGLSAGERFDEWHRIRTGEAKVVVGARSAVFAPLENLGLLIVDEEHDGSYKSDSHVFYQARDVAIMRAKKLGIPVVLGSATPSLESYAKARAKSYILLKLDKPDTSPRSKIELIDMASIPTSKRSLLSAELVLGIKERLQKKEQVILFVNRRGWAPYLVCRHCKEPVRCVQCSITMTYHRTIGKLICHSCGITSNYSETCSHCNSPDLELSGVGTQRVEDEIELSFPEAKIARLDKDATSKKGALHKTLTDFAKGEIDILVGTQIVSKGHDFPGVTLVGVLATDHSLNIPDFRASERTFQQLIQVAGRAGRKDLPGEVLVQTFQPKHFVLQAVKQQNLDAFYHHELNHRGQLNYPPYQRIVLIRLEGSDKNAVFERSLRLAKRLAGLAGNQKYKGILPLGPSSAPVAMVRGQHRFRILLKGLKSSTLHNFIIEAQSMGLFSKAKDMKIQIDIDPSSMM